MFTKKDREIANEKAKVKNRNKFIEYQENKIAKLESKLEEIKSITSMNNYGKPEVYLRKINELVRDYPSKTNSKIRI